MWGAVAVMLATLPVARGFTGSAVFYIRDLSLYFWGRYLWLRREWASGEWPLWDPHVGAGQAAVADALHQMFLVPAVLARLAGGEVFGFNLWVLLPFPLAALGAFLFFARRFSPAAASLGAAAFAVCGPVISTGNFPNLSWSIACLPWILWSVDALVSSPSPARLAAVAALVAAQAFAGEPVTLFTTLVLALGYGCAAGAGGAGNSSVRAGMRVAAAAALGLALSAIQLIPMAHAAIAADRAGTITQDFWSLRPTALVEIVWFQMFGDYFSSQSLSERPWMPLMFTGREPFFFSMYFGVPLLAVASYGLAGSAPRWWRLTWVIAGFIGLIAAFGAYTPIYPVFRDHAPLIGSFRFPVKYLLVPALALAAGAAAGWDGLARRLPAGEDARRLARARASALTLAVSSGAAAAGFAAACLWAPAATGGVLARFAEALGAQNGEPAASFMLRSAPRGAVPIVALSLVAAALLWRLSPRGALDHPPARGRAVTRVALAALFVLIAGDLVIRAWSINPIIDPAHLAQPAWVTLTKVDPHAKVYVGGKRDGTLDPMDVDGSRAFLNAPGLSGSASRAALSTQAVYYPSPWGMREMLSYDLPVLWPRSFARASERFMNATPEERDRFLDRSGVRYRVLPIRRAGGREPIVQIPYFFESFFFDWGPDVAPRVSVVPAAVVISDLESQITALFEPGWDHRQAVVVARNSAVAGIPGAPASPGGRVVDEGANWLTIDAAAGAGGGYLLVLDSYDADWDVRVDGQPADMVRANGLFRAVRLTSGSHRVEFRYRPRALWWGGAVSALAGLVVLALLAGWGRVGFRSRAHAPAGA